MTWNLGFIIILELEERSPAGKGSSVGPRGHGKAVPQEEKNVICQAPWLLNGVLLNPLQLNWQQVDFDLIKARSRLWQQMEICPQGLGEAKQSQGHTQITSSNECRWHETTGFSLSCVCSPFSRWSRQKIRFARNTQLVSIKSPRQESYRLDIYWDDICCYVTHPLHDKFI